VSSPPPKDMTRKAKPLPDQALLHNLFDYSVVTGNLYWRKSTDKANPEGSQAGSLYKHIGYLVVRVKGERYYIHRLIWKWVTGKDPIEIIDHADGNGGNNSWHNLREATKKENAQNQRVSTRNASGYKGVCTDTVRGGFTAQIRVNSRNVHLGCFSSAQEAHAAYCAAADEHYGAFAKYC